MPTAYTAMRNALRIVTGTPDDPHVTDRLADHDLECVAAVPEHPERVLVGTFDGGLHRSTDGGESFECVGPDEMSQHVMSLAISPHDPDEVWAGTEPSAIYRSTDGGDSWTEREGLTDLPSASEWYFPPRPDTHHVRWLEPDARDPDRLYVGIEAGAFVYTDDAGETWHERPPGSRRDNHSLAVHDDAPDRVYSAAGDGYAESENGGESWSHPQEGPDHRYCWSVAPDPGDPDTVLLSAASGASAAHSLPAESYVYRRRGDEPWERLDDRGLPTGEGVVRAVLEPGGSGEFYAASNHGLYRTTDTGEEWERFDADWSNFEEQTPRGLAVV